MANDKTQNPMIFDTPSTVTPQIYQDVVPGVRQGTPVLISKLLWNPTAGGQTLLVKNARGETVLSATSEGGVGDAIPYEKDFDPNLNMDGFWLYTMTAGTLYVYQP